MDFVRLAVVEMRRNSTRIAVATVAASLAAMIIVLMRFIPQGYALGAAMPQRAYINGDILIYPGLTGLHSENASQGEKPELKWQSWPGSDWQSHALDFFPQVAKKGYLVPEGSLGWRPMKANEIAEKLQGVPNVRCVWAYRSIPCVVQLGGSNIDAVLVGRDLPQDSSDDTVYPLDGYVHQEPGKPIRSLFIRDQGSLRALFPEKIKSFQSVKDDMKVLINLPQVTFSSQRIGLSWDKSQSFALECAGRYAIQVGEKIDESAKDSSKSSELPTIPVYYDRAEIVVPMETFAKILYILASPSKVSAGSSSASSTAASPAYTTGAAPAGTASTGTAPADALSLPASALFPPAPITDSSPAWVEVTKSRDQALSMLNDLPTYQLAVKVGRMAYLRDTTKEIRKLLGPSYGVYAVPELALSESEGRNQVVMPPDLHSVFTALIAGLASVIVSGNIYILVVQQRRKIGLLRVVGATGKNIMTYVLSIVAYVSLLGTGIGFLTGKVLYLLALISSDLTFKEWAVQAVIDFFTITGLSLTISLAIGFVIAYWASKIPCAEVLTRE